ncbi:hypothetical protein KSE_58760 [Kitasatospora setae KM-6054]|uniref:Uncharacterized protein n=1 Tax=Kitasatospora setae (strain ATCC 33774 / DSM 43861 / JCM 3304 / KCC A-0304 / NBRC 14216 / KM-6054) TaxID=452652 RepID=E4N0G2_KITSK|nr:hypothetical protein KSE_58760 [Kitasatospora setae KM-6054]
MQAGLAQFVAVAAQGALSARLVPRRIRRPRHPLTSAHCQARRGRLLLNVLHQVFARCRCAHEWDDFDTAMRALAFDGLLSGITWD